MINGGDEGRDGISALSGGRLRDIRGRGETVFPCPKRVAMGKIFPWRAVARLVLASFDEFRVRFVAR